MLLETGTTDAVKEQAAAALAELAVKNRVAITKSGAISPLVTLLENGTDKAKELAARALAELPVDKDLDEEGEGIAEVITEALVATPYPPPERNR